MYKNGTGVAQDDKQAVIWYRKSAEQEMTMHKIILAGCMQMELA